MNKLTLLLAVSLIMARVSAQDTGAIDTKNNEFGIHAGAVTGLGLSYRHWFGKAGFQLTALPIRTENYTFISAGATALYSFYNAKYVMVFGYLGNHWFMNRGNEENYNWNTGNYENSRFEHSSYSVGFGPGFAFGKTVRFNLMVGYGFYDVFEKLDMYPTGEVGLYYRF